MWGIFFERSLSKPQVLVCSKLAMAKEFGIVVDGIDRVIVLQITSYVKKPLSISIVQAEAERLCQKLRFAKFASRHIIVDRESRGFDIILHSGLI